ncbi:MAG: hypothetical protein ACI4MJ_04320 [Aristaeellaceae bacterium]
MQGLWKVDRQGFLTCCMVSGPKVEPYTSELRDKQQIRYETRLRAMIADHAPVEAACNPVLGQPSRLGKAWRYQDDIGSGFVDCSSFYSLMRKVTFDVAMCVVAPQAMDVAATLWSYAAVDLYLNGEKLSQIDKPVYKPITRLDVTLPLKAGRNLIYLACCNLGVRDTRSTVALQLRDHLDDVTVDLPDAASAQAIHAAERFLLDTRMTDSHLIFPSPITAPTRMAFIRTRKDESEALSAPVTLNMGTVEAALPEGQPYVTVETDAAGVTLSRRFERTELLQPMYADTTLSMEDNLQAIFQRIADVPSCPRGEGISFPMANMLARKHLGQEDAADLERFAYTLELIEQRIDCSDFMMCGLLRWLKLYGIPAGLEERTKQVLLNYRYWMDMDGFDGMCFWSENHALMFYSSAMLAGEMYPEDVFPRAKMTGRELAAYGRSLVDQWLTDVEEGGFEEFLSTVYMCVTFAAILNVVDFVPDMSERARKVTDRLLSMLALHTFKDGIIAPMGRVYRNVLYPFATGAMALMNMLDPTRPYAFGEGWIGFYAGSSYRLPDVKPLMDTPVETTYTTGNARIVLEKNADYCMTSVASPREDADFTRWTNETLLPDADQHTHAYTKSFNERFHGTTCFQPGTYGYQQHMWYAALDGKASVFVNHPGSMSERGDLRPGYWHGNGVMPAVKQAHGVIGAVYCIPGAHPLHYTHLYAPACRFDEVCREDGWLFLRKDTGYIGVWCSAPLEAFEEGMNPGCEWRAYGDAMAYLTVCGGREFASMADFMAHAKAQQPVFNGQTLHSASLNVTWTPSNDQTQYL